MSETAQARHNAWLFFGGAALVFNAGFINTLAFLGFNGKFVSHMTGNVAKVGVKVAEGSMMQALDVVLLIVAFAAGAVVNGLLIGSEQFSFNNRYGVVLLAQAALLGTALIHIGHVPDETLHHGEFLVAMVCGMQNSMTTIYSGAVVRTTHLTGTLTDLGSQIGHFLRGDPSTGWKIRFFATSAFSFATGSAVASLAFGDYGVGAMWVSVVVYVALAAAERLIAGRGAP